MKLKALIVTSGMLGLTLAGTTALAWFDGGYDLTWNTVDGGGGVSSGGGYDLHGSIGQPDTGVLSGGNYELLGGFWGGGPPADQVQSAVLTDVTRTLGVFVSGGLAELLASDDAYYVLQSGPGFNPAEPHPGRADFGFDTQGFGPSQVDVIVEQKSNIGGPTAVILIRNITTNQWDELDRFAVSPVDQTFTVAGVPAGDYVDGAGRLVTRVRTFAILILNPTVRGIFSTDFVGLDMTR